MEIFNINNLANTMWNSIEGSTFSMVSFATGSVALYNLGLAAFGSDSLEDRSENYNNLDVDATWTQKIEFYTGTDSKSERIQNLKMGLALSAISYLSYQFHNATLERTSNCINAPKDLTQTLANLASCDANLYEANNSSTAFTEELRSALNLPLSQSTSTVRGFAAQELAGLKRLKQTLHELGVNYEALQGKFEDTSESLENTKMQLNAAKNEAAAISVKLGTCQKELLQRNAKPKV